MDPLRTVARAIFRRRQLTDDLARAEKAFETIKWWNLVGRISLSCEISERRKELEVLNETIGDRQVLRLAEIYAEELWREAARSVVPDKNPFGPAAQTKFSTILRQARQERPDLCLWFDQARYWLIGLPEVDALVTDAFTTQNTQRIMAELSEVATSTTFLHRETRTEKEVRVVIQHVESGLRAEFTVEDSGFGEVMSKSGHIMSLDAEKPGDADHRTYAGLGIGRRLYRHAQAKYPGIRWRAGSLSVYAEALRSRLHAQDPYHWEGPCTWCGDNLPLGWKKSTPSSFAGHP